VKKQPAQQDKRTRLFEVLEIAARLFMVPLQQRRRAADLHLALLQVNERYLCPSLARAVRWICGNLPCTPKSNCTANNVSNPGNAAMLQPAVECPWHLELRIPGLGTSLLQLKHIFRNGNKYGCVFVRRYGGTTQQKKRNSTTAPLP
jgi:hypothetical protein